VRMKALGPLPRASLSKMSFELLNAREGVTGRQASQPKGGPWRMKICSV
jgi:hypothetical protein